MRASALFSAVSLTALATLSALAAAPAPAQAAAVLPAVQAAQSTTVGVVPASYTPNVNDGIVYAIGQVGSTVFLGGTFTSVSQHGSTATTTVTDMVAFTAGTGALVTSFAPTIGGEVDTIIPGPTPGTVYVGGAFKTIDGVTSRVALLNATTGAMVPGWTSPKLDGAVNKLVLADGQLFVGGNFDAIGGVARGGLASLNPTTGAVTTYTTLSFTGHHNYMVNCKTTSCPDGGVGIKALDVTPDGTRMIVIGNFTNASGFARNQVAMIDLSSAGAAVDPNWNTLGYSGGCAAGSFDSYVRDVQFSPDGSYLAIADTGAGGSGAKALDGTHAICDAVARFETNATGQDIQPTWVDWTGNDSFWTVAVTGSAIYVGGHQRWLNNSVGNDNPGEGATPRPGMAAVDPQNGLPLAWNPGRNPRGQGAFALLATTDGLYVGSDTDWIGDFKYQRDKIAFFPLAGGETLPTNATSSLPGTVYLFGPRANTSSAEGVSWDGSSAPGSPTPVSGLNASTVRGAFIVNGNLYYGTTSRTFNEASFNGQTVGTPTSINPYNDPLWATVPNGNAGGATYNGTIVSWYAELPSVTSMFYSAGRVYYTLAGRTQMFWRYFETDDGVVGADEFTTTDGNNWSSVAGAFLAGGTLYWANSTTGNLMSIPFTGGQPSGTSTVANSSMNWASEGAALLSTSQVPPNQPPVAALTVSCTTVGSPCSANGSTSKDPDGSITGYSWNWGDGTTTTGATSSHTYATAGTYTVTLTVTDNDNATGTASQTVHVTSATAAPIAFRAAATYDANGASAHVTIPASVQAGDELLLFQTEAAASNTAPAPAGWTLVGTTSKNNLTTAVYARPATASDAGATVSLTFSASVKASLTLAAYSSAGDPVEVSASASDTSTTTHVSPTVTGLGTGSYAITFWGDKSTTTSAWTAPSGVTQRSVVVGTGGGAVSALLVDSGAAVTGTYGRLTATTNVTSGSGTSWTIGLSPAS
jgi:hypothetical protein